MLSRRVFIATVPALAMAEETQWRAADPSKPHGWVHCRDVTLDPSDPKKLVAQSPGSGKVMFNGNAKTQHYVSVQTFGDLDLTIEFNIAKGSNSGVYLHGLYEVQVFDSYGTPAEKLETKDCGAIYHRWIDNKPAGGSIPKVNASLAPGQWQKFHIVFRAPRFDSLGRKTENARFVRVELNGKLVQENVEAEGCTRSCLDLPEAPKNPVMLQGDHGPVAYRNIVMKGIRP
jgi:hypothetical protein